MLAVFSAFIPLGGSVLDFGAGPGFFVEKLLARGLSCAACDRSPKAVHTLNERFKGRRGWLGAFELRERGMPVPERRFDMAFCLETLEHVLPEKAPEVIADLRRVLRDGGTLMVTVPGEEDPARNTAMCPECGCVFHRYQHVRIFSPQDLRSLMEREGFETVFCDLLPLWSLKNEGFPPLAELSVRRLGRQILLAAAEAADRMNLRRANPRRMLISMLRGRGDNLVWIGHKTG